MTARNRAPERTVSVIGATGSVGSSVLEICMRFPDRLHINGLASLSRGDKLSELAARSGNRVSVLFDETSCRSWRGKFPDNHKLMCGPDGLLEMVEDPMSGDIVFASSGIEAAPALIRALELGKTVFLANKESIVAAGKWIMNIEAGTSGASIIPLDSEHNAVWQCLRGESPDSIAKIYLTASGGPFVDFTSDNLQTVTPEMALRHPVWSMGKKISVDSATLMNKGLEIIEAHHLFCVPVENIGVAVHRSALVHAMVEMSDGNVKMLLSRPDMRMPVISALGFPSRYDSDSRELLPPPLDAMNLDFSEPDTARFPCLDIARSACAAGGAMPPLMVGADEVAVDSFLKGEIGFMDISVVIEKVLSGYGGPAPSSWEEAIALVSTGKRMARSEVN